MKKQDFYLREGEIKGENKMVEPLSKTFDTETISALGGLILMAMSFLYPLSLEFRKPKITENVDCRVFYSSQDTGSFRGYDFNKSGLLDKVEESSFSYRPSHLCWHEVDRSNSRFKKVQTEYTQTLKQGEQ